MSIQHQPEPVSDPYKLLLVSEAGTDDIAVLAAAMRLYNRKADILKTVDMLGVALADHGHQWTTEERAGYEAATRILRNPNTCELPRHPNLGKFGDYDADDSGDYGDDAYLSNGQGQLRREDKA